MKINTEATLFILNKKSKIRSYPSYDHVIVNGKKYTMTNLEKSIIYEIVEKYSNNSKDEYLVFEVQFKGEIIKTDGQMPNPMCVVEAIRIDEIDLKD